MALGGVCSGLHIYCVVSTKIVTISLSLVGTDFRKLEALGSSTISMATTTVTLVDGLHTHTAVLMPAHRASVDGKLCSWLILRSLLILDSCVSIQSGVNTYDVVTSNGSAPCLFFFVHMITVVIVCVLYLMRLFVNLVRSLTPNRDRTVTWNAIRIFSSVAEMILWIVLVLLLGFFIADVWISVNPFAATVGLVVVTTALPELQASGVSLFLSALLTFVSTATVMGMFRILRK
ncbi:hypothetical protein Pelo_8408 [Pelomyxa schiedti]|nr:hypothetical protein Pelo_8408 [Pelomyxa schiedti]